MACRKILVLGGVRSGKSRYAQTLVEATGKTMVFMATAEARDAEMAERIARHQLDRGENWQVIETPIALANAILEQSANAAVAVDCLTLWLSNIMLAEQNLEQALAELGAAIRNARCALALVTNEVGMGIVPETLLGRQFRDWQGQLNQMVARECDAVIMMIAGCPLQLKPAPKSTVFLE